MASPSAPHPRRSSLWKAAAAVACVLVAPAFAQVARGQESPPDPTSSAVTQYAELVPTGSGPTAPGVEAARFAALPPEAQSALAAAPASLATLLATIATSSDYGAPQAASTEGSPAMGSSTPDRQPSLEQTVQAAADVASRPADGSVAGLLLAALAITAGAAGIAIRRGFAWGAPPDRRETS
jgi:hypothetical protein